MRFLRALLLLVVLVPSIGPAAPCCAEPVKEECCGPTGECPATPAGACVLTAAEAPCVASSASSLEFPTNLRVAGLPVSSPPRLRSRWSAPLPVRDESPPLYLILHSLRI